MKSHGFTLISRASKGFTLIELLVAIAIISLLSAVGVTVFRGMDTKGRDSVRKSDLNQLVFALEGYLQKNGKYVGGSGTCGDSGAFYTQIAPFMNYNQVPKDPKTKDFYCYISVNDGLSYRLFARLESCTDKEILSGSTCGDFNYSKYSPDLTAALASGAVGPTPPPPVSPPVTPPVSPPAGLIAPTVNPVSGTCISGPLTGSQVTISWTSPNISYVDISTDPGFNTWFNKQIFSGSSTPAPTGFKEGSINLTIQPNVTYYARLWNGAPPHSPSRSFNFPTCATPPPPTGGSSIANAGSSTHGNVPPNNTWSLSCTGSNRLLVVATAEWIGSSTSGVTGITYGGAALSKLDQVYNTGLASIWYLKNASFPASGNFINVSYTGGSLALAASCWNNVNQTTTFGSVAKFSSNSVTPTINVASTTGDVVIDSLATFTNCTNSAGSGQSSLGSVVGGPRINHSHKGAGSASTSMSWTLSPSNCDPGSGVPRLGYMGVAIKPN